MSRKIVTKEAFEKRTRDEMKKLGVYKPEYNDLIGIYAELREQYERHTIKHKKDKYNCEVATAQGVKKAPIVTTLEQLRKDILAYSDRLCLNPKTLDGITPAKGKESKLGALLGKAK